MSLVSRKITAFAKKVADLIDRPSGTMTTAQLKAQFDSSPEELRVAHNGLVDDLASVTPGSSGAELIGSAPIAGVAGSTPYAQLSDIKNQINQAAIGQIPDGSITVAKLGFDVATQAELDGKFGAAVTTGVLDWNDVTNIRPGSGSTLLQGNAANGPGPVGFYHSFNFEFGTKDGSGTITQLAIPYDLASRPTASIMIRTRYTNVWTAWTKLWGTNELRNNAGVLEFNDAGTWKAAGGVKNVQRGISAVTAGATTNVTISSVNLVKSHLLIHSVNTNLSTVRLSSATNIEFAMAGSSGTFSISWEVVEFN